MSAPAGAADPRPALAAAGATVVAAGLVVGSGGNLSARVPGTDGCWVTGAGTWLDRLDADGFALVAADGSTAGDVPPSTEVALHLATYRARPDVHAIIHLHPQTTILLDAIGQRIRLLTTDHAYYVRRVGRVPFTAPGTAELAEAAAAAVRDGTNCVLLARHGCSVVGDTVDLALKRALNFEEAARLTYRARLLGAGDLADCPDVWTV